MLPVRILNFDDSLSRQGRLIKRFVPAFTDLREFAPLCRQGMSGKVARSLKSKLGPALKSAITFLGSGDFHHISSLLLEQFEEPISLIVFDHHPDWDIMPPGYGCGSWVTQVLRMPNLKKAVLLGVSSHDISTFAIQTGNLNALKNDRIEIYPYQHLPTRVVFRKIPNNLSIDIKRGFFLSEIRWRELKGRDLAGFISLLIARIPTKRIYISIDKDCLSSEFALTNWEEGCFKLDELLFLLKSLKNNFSLAGVDITGEYSPLGKVKGMVKAKLAALDHPKDYTACNRTQTEIDLINEDTNIKILETLA
jgi:arginase family enzyme